MLGLSDPPPKPLERRELTVQADLSVLAGVDLPADTLITLLKYARVQRFDDVIQLRLDPKAMRDAPADASPGDELTAALAPAGPLPQNVRVLLGEAAGREGGVLRYLWCSAIVTADDPAILSAVRSHSKLKGYLLPGGPPDMLVIRPDRDARRFLHRCRQYGHDLKPW